jgi:carboxyl-terminal processing protease
MLKHTLFIVLFALSIPCFAQSDYDFELSKSLDIYAELYQKLNLYYVDPLEPASLNQAAIEAALKQLDPYTVYYPESQMEDVAFMHSGKYGGIGANVIIRNDSIYVNRILQGYAFDKAGLRSGDLLLEIDGESLVGKNQEQMSDLLQGSAGSSFKLTYRPLNESKSKQTTIKREEIKIKNVPYAALLDDGIAYVRLDQFKQNAAADIQKAIDSLDQIQKVTGVVLDLRGNPGGLLIEAVNIVDLFVPAGLEVVATKGKVEQQNKVYKTVKPAKYPDAKLVVLVSETSASASEIVAGGIQDLDRGLVLGQKSFGKGLVQNVMPLSYHAQVKITIAKYYIPSGRCIQAIDYSHKVNGKAEKIPDSLFTTYYTKAGRPVKDAGGIVPDVKMEAEMYSEITQQLIRDYIIYDFANQFILNKQEQNLSDIELFEAFTKFVEDQNFVFESEASKHLKALMDASKSETYSSSIQASLNAIQAEINKASAQELFNNKEEIIQLIQIEIAARTGYDKEKLKTRLVFDLEVAKAIELLQNDAGYLEYLKVVK